MAIDPASLEPGLKALIGTELNGFEIHEPIGEGGMGVVFRGVQRSLGREVAVKVALPSLGPDQAARFAREGRTAALLDHPNCITVYEFGTDRGVQYMVMPLLRGRPLSKVLKKGSVPFERAVAMGIQILRGLEHAHSRGVVHRDLKPENVFIVEDENGEELLKLVDFGIAKVVERKTELSGATMSGLMSGTPEYMSPEQALGLPTDTRSDIYSAGIILYHLITGSLPFTDDDPIVQLRRHITDEVPALPPSVSPPLSRLVLRMVRKERDERYATVSEALEDLIGVSTGAHLLPSEGSVPEPPAFDSIPAGELPSLPDAARPADESGMAPVSHHGVETTEPEPLPEPEPEFESPSRARLWWGAAAAAAVVVSLTVGFSFGLSDAGADTDANSGDAQPSDEGKSPGEAKLLSKLSSVNNPERAQALGYQTRQAYLDELRGDADTAPLVDARLNLSLDLSQASQSETPCQTFRSALDAIEASGDTYFTSVVSHTKPPAGGSDSACDGLAERRLDVLAGLRGQEAEPVEEDVADQDAIETEVPPRPTRRRSKATKRRSKPKNSKPNAGPDDSPETSDEPAPKPTTDQDEATPAPWERREPTTEVKNPFQ